MSERIPFQYAVLRYIPDLITGEFLNIGLAVYSKPERFINVKLLTRYKRLTDTFPSADGEFYRRYINSLQFKFDRLIGKFQKEQITLFDEWPERIEVLLASVLPIDDSSIQFSEPMGGLAFDLEDTFDELYARLVEYQLREIKVPSRSNEQIWSNFARPLRERNILSSLRPKVIRTSTDVIPFDHAWKNGKWNLLQPLSFDLIDPTNIRTKARTWVGTGKILSNSDEWSRMYLLIGGPSGNGSQVKAYIDAKDTLRNHLDPEAFIIVEEHEADNFARDVGPQILHDTQASHDIEE